MSKEIKKKKRSKGFTLVELVIAVLIIGVIAAIAVPTYFKAVEKSRASEAISVLGTIAKAQQRNKLQSNGYTDTIDELDITLKDYSTGTNATGSDFDTEFFDFVLGEATTSALRKGSEDYTITVNYETNELTCSPAENKVCIALGLKEGEMSDSSPSSITPKQGNCTDYAEEILSAGFNYFDYNAINSYSSWPQGCQMRQDEQGNVTLCELGSGWSCRTNIFSPSGGKTVVYFNASDQMIQNPDTGNWELMSPFESTIYDPNWIEDYDAENHLIGYCTGSNVDTTTMTCIAYN